MWKTFLAELKHIFKHKWRPWEWLVIIFIPFLYGFLYMNAYWNPFGNVDKLKIGVVNLDKTQNAQTFTKDSKTLKEEIKKSGKKGLNVGNHVYKLNITDVADIYDSNKSVVDNLIKNNKYDAVVVIHKGYEKTRLAIKKQILTELGKFLINKVQGNQSSLSEIIKNILDPIKNKGLITFNNSVKHSYLAGEMTNFGAGLLTLTRTSFFPSFNELKSEVEKIAKATSKNIEIDDETKTLLALLNNDNKSKMHIVNSSHSWGKNINTYGFGLAPYFLSIGLWAGALVMTFLIKNERHIPDVSTMKHYFGKTLMWLLTGWIQSLILVTGITLQGVNLGINQWQLYLVGIFISTIFSLTIQAIAYALRYGDLGEFAAVICLIIQLVSSSGTFPVQVQGTIFKVINPIIPFTYAIHIIREIMFMPDSINIFKNIGILLIFPGILIPISLLINWIFDKKTKKVIDGKTKYKSFEISLGDF